MKIFSSDIGSDVIVWFLDHATNTDEPMKCKVRGEVIRVNKNSVVIRWWDLETEDQDVRENNQETCVIVQSAILGFMIMHPKHMRGFNNP